MEENKIKTFGLWLGIFSSIIGIFVYFSSMPYFSSFFKKEETLKTADSSRLNLEDGKTYNIKEGKKYSLPENKSKSLEYDTNNYKNEEKSKAFDYVIINESSEIEIFYQSIKKILEQNNQSVLFENLALNNQNSSKINCKKKIFLSGKLTSNPSSIDQSVLSSSFTYQLRIYDTSTKKYTNSLNERLVVVGFSEDENIFQLEKQFTEQINKIL